MGTLGAAATHEKPKRDGQAALRALDLPGAEGKGRRGEEGLLLVLSLALFAFPGTEDRAGREKKPGEAPGETS